MTPLHLIHILQRFLTVNTSTYLGVYMSVRVCAPGFVFLRPFTVILLTQRPCVGAGPFVNYAMHYLTVSRTFHPLPIPLCYEIVMLMTFAQDDSPPFNTHFAMIFDCKCQHLFESVCVGVCVRTSFFAPFHCHRLDPALMHVRGP